MVEDIERQLYIDSKIKSTGALKFDKNTRRVSEAEGFGETTAGKMFINQSVKGFVEKFHEYVEDQPRLSRSYLMRFLVVREDEEVGYRLDPYQTGRIVIRSLMRSLIKPEDKRITVTGVAFDIGEAVEFAIKEVLLDTHHETDKAKMMDMLRRQERLGNKEEVKEMLNLLSERVDLEHKPWDKKTQGAVGQSLLELLYISKVYYKGV